MKALVDADILLYEISFAAEAYWKHVHDETGEELSGSPPWDIVEWQIEDRIRTIMNESGAEGEPLLLFTGKNNFRERIAVTQKYKDRVAPKPFHYYNIKAFLKSAFKYFEEDGLEADDLIAIFLTAQPNKWICCTRDKDLRQVPGWHYGWEVNNQPSFGPELVDELGSLMLSSSRKLKGTGARFLYAQMLMGDPTDSIPGIPRYGDVKAFNTLEACNTIDELEEAVAGAYKGFYGLDWLDRMRETGRLVYMTRERKGNLIKLYTPKFLGKEEWMNLDPSKI